MPPDPSGIPEMTPLRRRLRVTAGVLQAAAMLLVMAALIRLTPLTMTLSVGVAGGLLALAGALYVLAVVADLRRRRIL
jgi:hypothetical protein